MTRSSPERCLPGEAFGEESRAREFNVSRTLLREALRRLGEDGLVEYEPHKGARVASLTADTVRDTFLVREAHEGIAAREAATRLDESALRVFREHYDSHRAAIDAGDRTDVGDGLHDLIFSAGASDRLRRTMANIMGQILWIQHLTVQSEERLRRSFREHDSIVLALEARDRIAAESAAGAHVRSTAAYVQQSLESGALARAS